MREPAEPARQVPGVLAEDREDRREQHETHNRRVDQEGDGDAEAHLLELHLVAGGEPLRRENHLSLSRERAHTRGSSGRSGSERSKDRDAILSRMGLEEVDAWADRVLDDRARATEHLTDAELYDRSVIDLADSFMCADGWLIGPEDPGSART